MSPVVLIALFTISSILCVLLLFILINPLTHAYIALLAVYGQLIVYCCCGELVATKASNVSNSIYCSQWYKIKDIETRRKILLPLLRAQRHCYMSLGGHEVFNMSFLTDVSYLIT